MTRRTYPNNMLENSSDADGDAISVSHIGIHPTATLVDWSTVPYVRSDMIDGNLEFYPDGTVVHDDLGDVSGHPAAGVTSSEVDIGFRIFDGEDYSTGVNKFTVTLEGASGGDAVAPVLVSITPADGSTGNSVTTNVTATYDEAIQEGSGTVDLYAVSGNTLIESFAIPADIGTGPGTCHISGNSVIMDPTSNFTDGIEISVRVSAGAVMDLSGNDCAAVTGDGFSFETLVSGGGASANFPDDPRGWRGQEVTYSYPTTQDHLVDATGGGDFTNVTAAMAAAVSGEIIRVKATGIYREAVTHKAGVTLTGWGTDRPLMSAQQTLSGFTQCDAGDTILGPVLGAASSPVYKKTGILKSIVPSSDLLALNPMEDHKPLFICQDRFDQSNMWAVEDDFAQHDPQANGGGYVLSGTTITGINDPVVINSSRYTNLELTTAKARIFASGNLNPIVSITAANVSTNTITVGGSKKKDATGVEKFAIVNAARSMTQGTFFFVDNGTTFDLYIYPYDSADIDKISILARNSIITLASSGSDFYIGGIDFEGAHGSGNYQGTAIVHANNSSTLTNVTVENCKFSGFGNLTSLQNGPVWLTRCDNILVQKNTFENCSTQGVFQTGSLITQTGSTTRRNVFKRTGAGGCSAFRQSNYAVFHNYSEECGWKSHANLGLIYLSGDLGVWFGNEMERCFGYFTSQDMTRPNTFFNHIPCDAKSTTPGDTLTNRRIENQGASGVGWCANNSAHAVTLGIANKGHMAINPSDPGATSNICNNIAHGMPRPDDMQGTVALCQYNLITHPGYSGSNGGTLDASDFTGGAGKFDTTNVFETDMAVIYADQANRDWSPASASSPQLTMGTYDIESVINALKAELPFVPDGDWYIDCFGHTIDYSALKMGADQSI